jgi:zeaxanthin epoxidase
VRSSHADWLLLAERSGAAAANVDATSSVECKGIYMGPQPAYVGRCGSTARPELVVEDVHAHERHACVWRGSAAGEPGSAASSSGLPADEGYYLKDLATGRGTWVNGRRIAEGATVQLWPGDAVEFGRHPSHEAFKVKMQHVSLRSGELSGSAYNTLLVGKVRCPTGVAGAGGFEQRAGEGSASGPFGGQEGSGNLVTA